MFECSMFTRFLRTLSRGARQLLNIASLSMCSIDPRLRENSSMAAHAARHYCEYPPVTVFCSGHVRCMHLSSGVLYRNAPFPGLRFPTGPGEVGLSVVCYRILKEGRMRVYRRRGGYE